MTSESNEMVPVRISSSSAFEDDPTQPILSDKALDRQLAKLGRKVACWNGRVCCVLTGCIPLTICYCITVVLLIAIIIFLLLRTSNYANYSGGGNGPDSFCCPNFDQLRGGSQACSPPVPWQISLQPCSALVLRSPCHFENGQFVPGDITNGWPSNCPSELLTAYVDYVAQQCLNRCMASGGFWMSRFI